MFVQAIENVAGFTAPIHTVERTFGSIAVRPGAGTMFFVNEEGTAVTCGHVASLIPFSHNLQQNYNEFKRKKDLLPKEGFSRRLKELVTQFGFDKNPLCELLVRLNCAESFDAIEVIPHPKYDLAILRLVNPKNLNYNSYARFHKSGDIKQGEFLCRLGFPFPEFQNFTYNASAENIQWTQQGIANTPRFPIEGMVTRHLADENGIFGIEMSTPGLRGQSGGPLFDKNGIVCGMQYATNHLHLGFDMKNKEVMANGERIKIANYQPFLHVGLCLHSNVIKNFLRENNVKFYEG
jgi:hypothetical protein